VDLITNSMLFFLDSLKQLLGDYGWAIIALTLLVRGLLWPVNQSQMKSMKAMQALQPKIKLLQDRHKADPQKLQAETMKLYQEHKFNPFGGCLPMLIQIPIFIGLYWAIMNPSFMSGNDPLFLKTIHLKHTGIFSHSGPSEDGTMNVAASGDSALFGMGKDKLQLDANIQVIHNDGLVEKKHVDKIQEAIQVLPKDPSPNIPISLSSSFKSLGLDGYQGRVKAIQITVNNTGTRETEVASFKDLSNEALKTEIPTLVTKPSFNFDILFLVIAFALTMIVSQNIMAKPADGAIPSEQQQTMKFLPYIFMAMIFFFPIPAGVLLYMVTNSGFQLFQTWWFNKNDNAPTTPPSQAIIEVKN
jgi:YidC/Oxa1 family membrane protein insertase